MLYGNAIDINPARNPYSRKFITDMPANVSDMAAKYGLSWGGDWKSIKDTMHFEWMGKRPWQNVPPANPIGNVPRAPTGGIGGGPIRGGFGSPQININGGSHDPEALATLVQRRVDESMNFRAHDTAYEYT
jgi:hypothetical protein